MIWTQLTQSIDHSLIRVPLQNNTPHPNMVFNICNHVHTHAVDISHFIHYNGKPQEFKTIFYLNKFLVYLLLIVT